MFKRIGLMTIITMTILFSGFFGQSTEASANVQRNLPHVKVNKFIYIDWQQIDWDQINDFLNRSLENWQNIYWDFEGNQKVEEEEAQKDEPEIEEPEEVQPQP